MNLARIEQLVQEKADQRAEEVFGLLFSLMQRQLEEEQSPWQRSYYESHELIIDGFNVKNVIAVSYSFNSDGKIVLDYTILQNDRQISERKEFQNVTTFSTDKYMDIIFDENNYLRMKVR